MTRCGQGGYVRDTHGDVKHKTCEREKGHSGYHHAYLADGERVRWTIRTVTQEVTHQIGGRHGNRSD